MINLKEQLHEGCILYFSCGGSFEWNSWMEETAYGFNIDINGFMFSYTNSGRISREVQHPFDIVKINPKPFDWKDVKQGMAFQDECKDDYYYVSNDFADDERVVVCEETDCSEFRSIHKYKLTRCPEGDLK